MFQQKFTFDEISEMEIDIPENYMAVAMVHFSGVGEHGCVKILVNFREVWEKFTKLLLNKIFASIVLN